MLFHLLHTLTFYGKKTDKSIQALKAENSKYDVSVENHPKLFLRVRPNGSKEWFYKYTPLTGNKRTQKKLSFGKYPQTGLAVAFEQWHNTNQLLAKGTDPPKRKPTAKRTNRQKQI